MAAPSYTRPLANLTKRLRLSPVSVSEIPSRGLHQTPIKSTNGPTESTSSQSTQSLEPIRPQSTPSTSSQRTSPQPVSSLSKSELEAELQRIRLPRAVQATYLTPLRHREAFMEPGKVLESSENVAQIQMRSYSVRNLEAFADFAIRAAFFLKLPAYGPNPLPRITQRWTVPRSNFIFKKSQENFERITLRRLITIRDGHPESVAVWLAFLQKHRYYGIGLKANVWERSGLEFSKEIDKEVDEISKRLGEKLSLVGSWRRTVQDEETMESLLYEEPLKAAWASHAPMAAAESAPHANDRFPTVEVRREGRADARR